MNDDERRLLQDSGRILRQAEEEIDAQTLSRLARGRTSALGDARRRSMFPAVGLAAALAGAAIGAFLLLRPAVIVPEASLVADLELLASEEPFEFFEEIEFYEWLVETGDQGLEASDPVGVFPDPADAGSGPVATHGRTPGDGDAGISRRV